MVELWFSGAEKYNGLPLEDRAPAEFLKQEMDVPALSLRPPGDRQTFYPGASEVPDRVALQYFGRSFVIVAEVTIETPEVSGVLWAHGGRFGGHSLYIKAGPRAAATRGLPT